MINQEKKKIEIFITLNGNLEDGMTKEKLMELFSYWWSEIPGKWSEFSIAVRDMEEGNKT